MVTRPEEPLTALIVERPRSTKGSQSRRFSDGDYLRRLKKYHEGSVTIIRTTTIDEAVRRLRQEQVAFVVGMTASAIGREAHHLLNLAEASVQRGAVFLLLKEKIDSRVSNWRVSAVFSAYCSGLMNP